MTLLACLGRAGEAGAQAEDRAGTEPVVVRRVEVAFAGSPEAFAAFESALHELFGRTHVMPTVRLMPYADWSILTERPAPGAAVPLARAFVDLRGQNAIVIVADGPSREVMERRDLPASGSLEMTVEETSHVVYGLVDSLLRSPRRSMLSRESETEPRPPPVPPATVRVVSERSPVSFVSQPSPTLGIDAQLFGQLDVTGSSLLLWGASGAVEVSVLRLPLRPGLRLMTGYYAKAAVSAHELQADVNLASVRLLPLFDLMHSPFLVARAGAGGGGDWFRLTPGDPPDGGSRKGEASNVHPMLTAVAEAQLRVSLAMNVIVGLGLDFDLGPRKYVILAGSTEWSLFAPERVRPSFFAGFSFPVSGASEPLARPRAEQAVR